MHDVLSQDPEDSEEKSGPYASLRPKTSLSFIEGKQRPQDLSKKTNKVCPEFKVMSVLRLNLHRTKNSWPLNLLVIYLFKGVPPPTYILWDVDPNHQIFSSRSSLRIAFEIADAPTPQYRSLPPSNPIS